MDEVYEAGVVRRILKWLSNPENAEQISRILKLRQPGTDTRNTPWGRHRAICRSRSYARRYFGFPRKNE